MSLRYGSVCSGIEAATAAWHPLGWTPAFFAEIDKFPSAVLAHHYGSNMPGEPPAKNGVPNHGDFTKIGADAGPVDLLVGGTPCQSFSVAGKRLGLDDPRGNLALEYLRLARRLRARWIVWENVPGVLSSSSTGGGGAGDGAGGHDDGSDGLSEKDFAIFLQFVQECGYGFAYRVLDAQYARVDGYPFAVPQRRRRVFLVGYLGDWRRAAAVLLEPESMRGDPAPRRKAGQRPAPTIASRPTGGGGLGTDFDCDGGLIASPVAPTLNAHFGDKMGLENQHIDDGTGRGTPLVPVKTAYQGDTLVTPDMAAAPLSAQGGNNGGGAGQILCAPVACDVADPLTVGANQTFGRPGGDAVAFDCKASGRNGFGVGDVSPTLRAMGHSGSHQNAGGQVAVQSGWQVRRLTPTECERLQGFPDGYTAIPWRGKAADACPDGPRYKALGNSMAVNVMRWLGRRINIMERLIAEGKLPE